MIRRPPRSTRTDTLFPYTTLFRSSNTTISRPPLASPHAGETGGLSGAPLHDLALQRLRDFRKATAGAIPLIGVGGISSANQAYRSEERRVGKECVSTCRSRWSPYH